ncbi:hypothetical protein [Rubellimicrobium roseum]|uniref:EF-hand domain-containing protein n=1 Tax=Rubellimicrobium roseum TaxID=687525 RepID=A0A5C4N7D7_9RHOB|nr:hypothetical protein [Rubellimicrobium roseum]TNC66282.1 hypothetical protein FHG71_16860 [Rubellimicrobium roseum]
MALRPWDIDGDGIIVRDEFLDGFADWGTFGDFDVDADGLIAGEELSEGIFELYDNDFDGLIEEPELTEMGDDMGDGGLFDV